MSKFNPFGQEAAQRSALEIMQSSFGIGFREFDRGASVWDPNNVNKEGQVQPAWVHQPQVEVECVVEFTLNEGKGTGRQCIPASEFSEYVNALQEIIDTDYAVATGSDPTRYVPTYEHVVDSFKMVRPKRSITKSDGTTRSVTDQNADASIVSVRCTGGKGAKPMLVERDEFPQVVAALRGIEENLSDYVQSARERYEQEVPDAALGESSVDAENDDGEGSDD